MPRLLDADMQTGVIPGSKFQFSAVRPEDLEETEYTLVTVALDMSGSVGGYENDILDCLKTIVDACQKNQRSENLMLRVLTFDTRVNEVHGFKPLSSIDKADYPGFNPGGMTALFDAAFTGIGATLTYGETLADQDFTVNGAIYLVTDGDDNSSTMPASAIEKLVGDAKRSEKIDSCITVLIGIGSGVTQQYLDEFKNQANLTQAISMGDITAGKLAKLAGFVSQSVSSQSQALGSGGPSVPPSLAF